MQYISSVVCLSVNIIPGVCLWAETGRVETAAEAGAAGEAARERSDQDGARETGKTPSTGLRTE